MPMLYINSSCDLILISVILILILEALIITVLKIRNNNAAFKERMKKITGGVIT
jgi:hypothetical protein